jgi:sarcosine oxidase delta subunit
MRGEPVELACPFCDKGKIQAWHIPGTTKIRRLSGSFGKGMDYSKSADIWIIKTGCPVCGRSQEEIEKELKKRGLI